MSRKSPSEAPPPGAPSLTSDFQSFCSSPALVAALKESSLASQLTQQMVPSPTSASSLPQSDYHSSTQCLPQHSSKSFGDLLLVFPDTQAAWDFYQMSSKFSAYFSPGHFTSWVSVPPVLTPPSSSHLASQLLESFRSSYPRAVLVKGNLPSDPTYGTHLSLLGTTSPSSPLPSVSENAVESVTLLPLLCGVSTYCTHSGTTSLETTLRPHFDALKYSTSRIKYPEYGTHATDSSYHTDWFTHYHSTSLARSPHLLTQQLKALVVTKSTVFSLAAHRKYLQSAQLAKTYHPVLSVDPAKSLKDFKDLTSLSMSPSCTGECAKSLQSGADTLDSFTQLTYELTRLNSQPSSQSKGCTSSVSYSLFEPFLCESRSLCSRL